MLHTNIVFIPCKMFSKFGTVCRRCLGLSAIGVAYVAERERLSMKRSEGPNTCAEVDHFM